MEESKTILQLFNLYKDDIYKMDSKYYEILTKIGEQEKLLNKTCQTSYPLRILQFS